MLPFVKEVGRREVCGSVQWRDLTLVVPHCVTLSSILLLLPLSSDQMFV